MIRHRKSVHHKKGGHTDYSRAKHRQFESNWDITRPAIQRTPPDIEWIADGRTIILQKKTPKTACCASAKYQEGQNGFPFAKRFMQSLYRKGRKRINAPVTIGVCLFSSNKKFICRFEFACDTAKVGIQ